MKGKVDWVQTFVVAWSLSAALVIGAWFFAWQRDLSDIEQLKQQVVSKGQDTERIQEEITGEPEMAKKRTRLRAAWFRTTRHRPLATPDGARLEAGVRNTMARLLGRKLLQVKPMSGLRVAQKLDAEETTSDKMPRVQSFDVVLDGGLATTAALTKAIAAGDVGYVCTVQGVDCQGSRATVQLSVYVLPGPKP